MKYLFVSLLLFLTKSSARSAETKASTTGSSGLRSSPTEEYIDYHVPTLELSELQEHPAKLRSILQDDSSSGLIAVSVQNSPSAKAIQEIRDTALQSVCSCLKASSSFSTISTNQLIDGTRRTTLATATIGETPVPIEPSDVTSCDSGALEDLRDVVAGIAKEFTRALDDDSTDDTVLLRTTSGKSFGTFSGIVKASHNLEHFHLYEKETCEDDYNRETVLPMHTDAGLFLVFVPGVDCDATTTDQQSDLYLEQHDGVERRAVFPENSFGIMFGTGAEHWLLQNQYKAAKHAVRMRCGARRAWYGMMHLVPQDAILQDLPQRTFADLRHSMAYSKDRKYVSSHDHNFASIGCGGAEATTPYSRIERRHRLEMVEDPSACNNVTNFFCWMSCLEVPEPPQEIAGASLYCLDPHTFDVSQGNVSAAVGECTGINGQPGAVHNDICIGEWKTSAEGVPEALDVKEHLLEGHANHDLKFCYGGTSMYMDGFHWLGNTCVIYLFPEWVVSTTGALVGACFGTILFGMALEGIIRLRRHVVTAIPVGTWKRLLMSATFYGLQLTMGYMIMLIVMTYSGPLFLSVILGLMGGHVVFNADQARPDNNSTDSSQTPSKETSSIVNGSSEEFSPDTTTATLVTKDDRVPEGCTPCCQNTL